MKVYLFSDYLKYSESESIPDECFICDIDAIDKFPDGLIMIDGKLARSCMMSNPINSDVSYLFIEYVSEPQGKTEVAHSANITCPHCGNFDGDSWESDDYEDNRLCESCGSVFSYTREIEVTYNSTIVERNEIVTTLKTQ